MTTQSTRIPVTRSPWRQIPPALWGVVVAIGVVIAVILILAVTVLTAGVVSPNNPTVPVVPVTQPVVPQVAVQAPVPAVSNPQVPQNQPSSVVAPKVHVEWTQIGTAHNGNEVVTLGIPWDQLIYVPVELIENLPPGVTGVAGGLPTERGTVVLFTYAQTVPWVYTYWKGSEVPISYAPKPWVNTQTGKIIP